MEGLVLAVVTAPGPALEREITTLLHRTSDARRHPALGEQKRLALARAAEGGGDTSGDGHVYVGLVARQSDRPGLSGYAQIDGDTPSRAYAVEMVVDPTTEEPVAVAEVLLTSSVVEVRRRGGGTFRLWASKATDGDDALAAAHGFRVERNLVQMRCALPLPELPADKPTPAVTTRPFRPGLDETAWLATNSRAFATHPEQGHWDLDRLLEREKEPWFDPAGFLLFEDEGRLVGSCWTKVHAGADPPMGEIYVIGVDPDFHGRGWGRALTLAGLDWLAGRGLRIGMLYVDDANQPARSMYRSLGFTDQHVDRAYIAAVEPA